MVRFLYFLVEIPQHKHTLSVKQIDTDDSIQIMVHAVHYLTMDQINDSLMMARYSLHRSMPSDIHYYLLIMEAMTSVIDKTHTLPFNNIKSPLFNKAS
jgi:hypothetical protein